MKTKVIATVLVAASLATGCENPKQAIGTFGKQSKWCTKPRQLLE